MCSSSLSRDDAIRSRILSSFGRKWTISIIYPSLQSLVTYGPRECSTSRQNSQRTPPTIARGSSTRAARRIHMNSIIALPRLWFRVHAQDVFCGCACRPSCAGVVGSTNPFFSYLATFPDAQRARGHTRYTNIPSDYPELVG